MKTYNRAPARRGWALAISLIMAFMLASIAGVTVTMTSTNRKVNIASFTYHAMQPIAEAGVDSTMKALHRYVDINTGSGSGPISGGVTDGSFTGTPGEGWSLINKDSAGLVSEPGTVALAKNFGLRELGDGRKVLLKVKVANVPTAANPASVPYVVSDVSFPTDALLASSRYSRQFLAQLGVNTSVGSGMIALNSLRFIGSNVFIGGYDSNKGVPSVSNLSDQVTVGSPITSLDIGAVNVYGFVAVAPGGLGITFSKNAHVWDSLSESPYNTAGVDPTNLSQSFDKSPADYPPDGLPEILQIAGVSALPAKTAANTIIVNKKGEITLGGAVITGLNGGIYYLDSNLSLSGKPPFTVTGNTTIIAGSNAAGVPLTSGGPDIAITGQGGILVASTSPTPSRLNLFTSGDLSICGNGILTGTAVSPAVPNPGMLYISGLGVPLKPGDKPTQTITMTGNGALSGVVYAPAALLELKGGGSKGSLTGSIVSWDITANGVITFFYDVNLAEVYTPKFRVGSITELNGAAKVPMDDIP